MDSRYRAARGARPPTGGPASSVLDLLVLNRVLPGALGRVVRTLRLRRLVGELTALAPAEGAPVVGVLRSPEDEGPLARREPGAGAQHLGAHPVTTPLGTRVHLARAVQSQDVLVAIVMDDSGVHGIRSGKHQTAALGRSDRDLVLGQVEDRAVLTRAGHQQVRSPRAPLGVGRHRLFILGSLSHGCSSREICSTVFPVVSGSRRRAMSAWLTMPTRRS